MGSLGDRVASQFLLSDRAGGRSTLLTLVQSFQILRFRFSLRALATHSLSDIHVFLKCKPRKKIQGVHYSCSAHRKPGPTHLDVSANKDRI